MRHTKLGSIAAAGAEPHPAGGWEWSSGTGRRGWRAWWACDPRSVLRIPNPANDDQAWRELVRRVAG